MYSSDKYGRLKKQIDRYFLPAQINSQFILQAIKQEDKKNQSPIKQKNETMQKFNSQTRHIDFLKITGKQLNSNFVPINLSTPKPRNLPSSKNSHKNSLKKTIDMQQIRIILNQYLLKIVEMLNSDPQSYLYIKQLEELNKLKKNYTNDAKIRDSIDQVFPSQNSIQLNMKERERIEKMITNNMVLYQKMVSLYRNQKYAKQKQDTSLNLSPQKKSNLIDGIISRRATGTIRKFMQSTFQKNLSPAQLKKHYSYIKYRQFLFTINASNKIIIYPQAQIQYKAFICKGNNGLLIKSIVKSRPWWALRSYSDVDNCSLVWTQWKKNKINEQLSLRSQNIENQRKTFYINYQRKNDQSKSKQSQQQDTCASKSDEKSANHSTKKQQFLSVHGLNNSEMLLKFLNETNEVTSTTYTFTRRINQKKFQEISKKYINHSIHHFRQESISTRGKSSSTSHLKNKYKMIKICNHIPGCFQLHSKKLMFSNLKKYYEKIGKNIFNIVPETYIVTSSSLQDKQYLLFEKNWQKNQQEKNTNKNKNIWICKPGQNSNRGHGITVVNSLDQIKGLMKNRNLNSRRTLLIQKYIQNPYVYHRRKFDIRCFILITCVNGFLKCYWHNQGYIRTASKQFSLKNLDNKYIHLTNDAIQKKAQEYGKFENCNKISFSQFEKYAQSIGDDPKKFKIAYEKMKQICQDLVRSCAHKLNSRSREYCFQLFGMDFMLDYKMKPYLIQANSNPCLQVDGSILSKIIPSLIQNTIKIAIDPLFPPPYSQIPKSSRFSPANPFQTNKYELIYDSGSDNQFRQRIDQIDGQMFEQDEEDEDLQNNLEE